MPSDPIMLLSFVNTQLRDNYDDLEDLCSNYNVDHRDICQRLESINYSYDPSLNRFV